MWTVWLLGSCYSSGRNDPFFVSVHRVKGGNPVPKYAKALQTIKDKFMALRRIESRPLKVLGKNVRDGRYLRLVCISDTHGQHNELKLPPGDTLIHSGDFMNAGESKNELYSFANWLDDQKSFTYKIVVAGNHDRMLDMQYFSKRIRDVNLLQMRRRLETSCIYLEDSGVTIKGYHFYGSPWTPSALGWAFFRERGPPISAVWNHMLRHSRKESRIDVLITHGPPFGIGDSFCALVGRPDDGAKPSPKPEKYGMKGWVGDADMMQSFCAMEPRPFLHVFGHVHSSYGCWSDGKTLFCNVASANDNVKVGGGHPPIVVLLPLRE